MLGIEEVCRVNGVRIVTQIRVERTEMGDRAIVGSEWAVAALKEWPEMDGDDPEALATLNRMREAQGLATIDRLP